MEFLFFRAEGTLRKRTTRRGSDRFLEILENREILAILEIPPVKRPLS